MAIYRCDAVIPVQLGWGMCLLQRLGREWSENRRDSMPGIPQGNRECCPEACDDNGAEEERVEGLKVSSPPPHWLLVVGVRV